MGVYRAAIVTENGQNLIAQALANEKPLIFTSAKTSSYSYPVGTDVPALTGLQDVVQSVLPFDSKVLGGNVAQVSVRFDNDGVDQTYRIETIGLYAKIEGGAETLFSVTQATTPDEMPVQSDISPSAYIYNIQHTVQNASQITLTVNPAGTATVQDIMDIESPEFDDSGTVEGISSFPSFLETMKSKMNFFQFFRNLKAGLQFVLHAGQIVNNCVTDNAGLPLSAAQGKVLKDLYTQLYSEMSTNSWSQLITVGDVCGIRLDYRYNPCLKLCEIFWDGKNSAEIKVNSKNFMWDGFPDDKLPKRNTFVPMASTTPGLTIRFYPFTDDETKNKFVLTALVQNVNTGCYVCGRYVYSY